MTIFDRSAARADLPAATAAAYLNAGTFGPLPRPADAAMRAHMETSFERGRIGGAGIGRWLVQMDHLRAAFAATLGAHPDTVALAHATTDGCNTVLWGSTFAPGDEVLTTTHEHPGLTAPLDELARVRSVTVRAVAPEDLVTSISAKTKLVAFSHVLWTTGEVLPAADIARAAHAHGARVLVDGAQSVGAIPVDPGALGVDYYTVSGQKWLCGPSGTGALWIRPEALASLGTPWPWYLSRSRSASGVTEWTTARRLDATTISMTAIDGAIAALAWHQGQVANGALEASAASAKQLRDRLSALANVEVLPVRAPSTIVSFRVTGEPAPQTSERLEKAGVLVRPIPGIDCVRASVGFWNDDADLERLASALRG